VTPEGQSAWAPSVSIGDLAAEREVRSLSKSCASATRTCSIQAGLASLPVENGEKAGHRPFGRAGSRSIGRNVEGARTNATHPTTPDPICDRDAVSFVMLDGESFVRIDVERELLMRMTSRRSAATISRRSARPIALERSQRQYDRGDFRSFGNSSSSHRPRTASPGPVGFDRP